MCSDVEVVCSVMNDDDKITDVYVEWDDPRAFRVYLVRAGGEDDARPMRNVGHAQRGSVEERLVRAAFVKNPKDFMSIPMHEQSLGWSKKGPAERAAKAVKTELVRIERGEPEVDDATVNMAAQLAKVMYAKKRR